MFEITGRMLFSLVLDKAIKEARKEVRIEYLKMQVIELSEIYYWVELAKS